MDSYTKEELEDALQAISSRIINARGTGNGNRLFLTKGRDKK
jgi:hypothetical protein